MEKQQRAFKGIWIPVEIWLNKDLTMTEKVVYAEIDSFCNNTQKCFASNKHFAQLVGISENRISHVIASLEKKGYIKRHITYKPGTKEIEKRLLQTTRGYCYSQQGGIVADNKGGIVTNNKDNNTVVNNTVSNTVEQTDGLTDDLKPLIDFCQDNVEILTPFKLQMLEGYVTDFGIEWVQKGLELLASKDRSKQNMKYLGGVLNGWKRDGVPKPWIKDEIVEEEPISGAEFMRQEAERQRLRIERDERLAALARQQQEQMQKVMRC